MFVVGMNKTGTSTMKGCFERLGWTPVASPNTVSGTRRMFRDIFERGDYSRALAAVPHHLGFEDRPWNVWELYRHVDHHFPDSRFVLTVRSPDTWWRSVEQWLTRKKPQMVDTYATHLRAGAFTREAFLTGFERHNDEIRRWFAGTDKLLEIDVEDAPSWEPISAFLGVEAPDEPFPHRNRQRYR